MEVDLNGEFKFQTSGGRESRHGWLLTQTPRTSSARTHPLATALQRCRNGAATIQSAVIHAAQGVA